MRNVIRAISIRKQILTALTSGFVVATILAAALAYWAVTLESQEMLDWQLLRSISALPSTMSQTRPPKAVEELDEETIVQTWGPDGRPEFRSHDFELPRASAPGYHDIEIEGRQWRTYAQQEGDRFVQASQSQLFRHQLSATLAASAIVPFVVLFAIIGFISIRIAHRALAPIDEICSALERRAYQSLESIPEGNTPVELLPIVRAINRLLQRVAVASASQQAFVADAAHELRSPLTALQLQMQLALRSDSLQSMTAVVAAMEGRVSRATNVVNQLLQLAKSEDSAVRSPILNAGGSPQDGVDMKAVVVQVIQDLATQAETKRMDLGLSQSDPFTAGAGALVNGDATELYVLVRNLVDNAIKYSDAGTRIDVAVRSNAKQVTLSVSDEGPGIQLGDGQVPFRRFSRGAGHGALGSGLGLAIVKSIADRHRAAISLEHNSARGGLTVEVIFPRRLPD